MASTGNNTIPSDDKKYKGVRRRKWGKWVSEIRVPGTQERLWLGSYSSPEAAAVAHDVAYYCLRRPSTMDQLNFPPMMLPLTSRLLLRDDMSPGSIQKAASDAGMAVDAQFFCVHDHQSYINGGVGSTAVNIGLEDNSRGCWNNEDSWRSGSGDREANLSVSVEDYM